MPFKKGLSGNPKGRRPGSKNKTTTEIRFLVQEGVDFRVLIKKLEQKAKKGHEPCARLLFQYGFGQPTSVDELTLRTVNAGDLPDLSEVPVEELREQLLTRLKLSSRGVRVGDEP